MTDKKYKFEKRKLHGGTEWCVIGGEITQHLFYESQSKAIDVYETCLRLGAGALFREALA